MVSDSHSIYIHLYCSIATLCMIQNFHNTQMLMVVMICFFTLCNMRENNKTEARLLIGNLLHFQRHVKRNAITELNFSCCMFVRELKGPEELKDPLETEA